MTLHRRVLAGLALAGALAGTAARADAPSAPAPWRATASVTVESREMTFRNAGVTLSGTLHAPVGGVAAPAVVVLHGASSPTRDLALYRHLVEMLPPLGIAVFVYDRRGSGKSGGDLKDSDYALLAEDGLAARRMLARDPRIDPGRIGFWGLSQGGWLAVLAAAREPEAAFAVSVSAPMTTPDVQMNFATASILRIKGYGQADIAQAIATRGAVDDYLRGRLGRAPAQAALDAAKTRPWFGLAYIDDELDDPATSRWVRDMAHDPLTTLDRVRAPTLLIFGAADPWIPVEVSMERLSATGAGRPHVEAAVVAGADHAMMLTMDEATQIDPAAFDRQAPESAAYLGLMADWLGRQGLTRKSKGR